MRIFLSWSGERSRAVAELLDEWLQCVIQAAVPWMSTKDIDRGSLWFNEIADQLQNTSIGIICLTKENKNKPWILFEAGALAKGLSSNRVCTLLIDLQPTDVGNPLAQFNHTFPVKDSIWQLVVTLNNSLKEQRLKEKILEQVFETYWSQFDQRLKDILSDFPETGENEVRSENDILLEILSSTRSMERRVRMIENDSQHRSDSQHVRPRLEPDEARNLINELINDGVPEEVITSVLSEKGVPFVFIRRALRNLRKDGDDV
ncbi:toll-Interleukin receptor [Rheinheimera sp. SA_1]|uniref:TIR domain-containing protein n=1 Tax=Rheinheimera sp. SA_1 TaxID=1827365 RepID=UPI0007FBC3AE|nr:TIR domain-containing protein [Rheinheimera sp. SA_1]OBP14197.1 toll-Interleukin receptor [Rheinheimera sp. SA_1]